MNRPTQTQIDFSDACGKFAAQHRLQPPQMAKLCTEMAAILVAYGSEQNTVDIPELAMDSLVETTHNRMATDIAALRRKTIEGN